MAAPTPVSAYLHSATMVKAGVFLLARLYPTLGAHPVWQWLVPLGAFTAVFSAFMAFRSDEMKKVLAYTTVMALGTLTLLIGMGEAQAAVGFLLAHAETDDGRDHHDDGNDNSYRLGKKNQVLVQIRHRLSRSSKQRGTLAAC